jgi:hypothetical protein
MYIATASSKKQVYNFKGNFNAAMQGIFAAAGITANIERANATLPTTGFDIAFDMGEAMNEQTLADGTSVYDFFQGNKLTARIYTERAEDKPSAIPGVATLHDEFCATVYAIMEERVGPFDPFLPYYEVNMIKPRGTQSGLDPRFMIDWTTITFEVWFGIRPSAWPTS